jgi:NAD(P)-dependent dehydrogenase (short-subunit alcohol dehydrogenase family)
MAAVDLARHNINVNCIVPGYFVSPINIDSFKQKEGLLEATLRRIPLRRPARMEEMTDPAIFLSSDAGDYITGQTIIVDGGWSIYGNPIF